MPSARSLSSADNGNTLGLLAGVQEVDIIVVLVKRAKATEKDRRTCCDVFKSSVVDRVTLS